MQISVIIPVFNDNEGLAQLLGCLERQTFVDFEVIVVDNSGHLELPQTSPLNLKFCREPYRNAYRARNRGVKLASGGCLVFTDADCRPRADWLHKIYDAYRASGASIVAGKVAFSLPQKPTLAQRVDARSFLNHEFSVKHRACAFTANLLIEARVFNQVGPFSVRSHSGCDAELTRRATALGYQIYFADDAVVEHPARTLLPLLRKCFRIGRGKADLRLAPNTVREPSKEWLSLPLFRSWSQDILSLPLMLLLIGVAGCGYVWGYCFTRAKYHFHLVGLQP